MQIKKFIYVLMTFFVSNSFAQTTKFKDGIYMSIEQLKSQSPASTANMVIAERTSSDFFWEGGNDYKILNNNSFSNSSIKEKFYAYVNNDSVFLNCYKLNLGMYYALVLTKGNFLAFKSCVTYNDTVNGVSVFTPAIVHGIMASKQAKAKIRGLYVLSLRTGNVRRLTKDYLIERLKEHSELATQYESETDKKSENVLIKYINLLNEVIVVKPTSEN